jgi:DNA-nicking Smr family endonuclease
LASKITAESGFFLAFLPINDQALSIYLVNNTDIDILFTLGETKDGNYAGLAAGHLTPRSSQKVGEANLGRFDKWSPLLVQALFYKAGFGTPKEPLLRKFSFVANTFFKSKRLAPGLGKEAYTFQIDQKIEAVNLARLDAEKLKESLTERHPAPAELPKKMALPVQRKNLEVDLHIEQLTPQAAKMNAGQMLELQLDVFEKQLDQAILQNANEITFIHGVGNGTLRAEIQKRLGRHPHVQFFQDARKERFGYGATLVKFK